MYLYGGQGEKGRSMEPGQLDRIIFGGVCLPENQLLNDIWIFDYSKIDNRSNLTDVSGAQCIELQTYGQKPSPRRGMCSFSVDKKLFIFGGQCQEKDEETNILYCLSYDNWEWAVVECIGQPPPSRSFLTAGLYTNRRVIFFGGLDNETSRATNEVNILTLNDFYWSSPFQAGMKAGPRYHHSSCLIENDNNERQMVILGGLDFTFCSMELCILYETDADQVQEWEQLQEPSEIDLVAQEKAGLMIFENKQQINELNDLISQERQKLIKQKEEKELFDQEQKKEQEEQKKNEEQQKQNLQELQNKNMELKRNMEDIFLLIKQEQLLSKELVTKNKLLEITVQKVQDYLMPLDQFFTQLLNNKFDEKDQKEIKLKAMIDEVKDEVLRSRDLHKESLYRLKKNYERINQGLQKSEQDLDKNRKSISQIDKQYEQIICETEVEEQ
ncbi:hypothetical protein PPERSA_09268 [Pseudocohnilembus persalinus]|uniref:Galactose oxidase/kelch, beta-propeller n=1 Tax=Pseudocohnilembus persalinus TaxID=266149 RepID=A0A0V0QMH2_PSEPJ|nr:hypothetical protein PPERSA_09268 [Pseudocohnilembus persalinus]|eukprot:KRX03256.1 hypothetical protein PPERSA_09268 [Pseudocohnilembus persalinus]